jgi:hypothetical protein
VAALAPLIGVRPESIQLAPWADPSFKAQPLSGDPTALAKALTEVIRTQFGSRLTASDLATITRQVQAGLERVDRLRKVELSNGDEPDFVFAAYWRQPRPS